MKSRFLFMLCITLHNQNFTTLLPQHIIDSQMRATSEEDSLIQKINQELHRAIVDENASAYVNQKNPYDETLLQSAIRAGYIKMAKHLLSISNNEGVRLMNIDHRSSETNEDALNLAIKAQSVEIVQELLSLGAVIGSQHMKSIMLLPPGITKKDMVILATSCANSPYNLDLTDRNSLFRTLIDYAYTKHIQGKSDLLGTMLGILPNNNCPKHLVQTLQHAFNQDFLPVLLSDLESWLNDQNNSSKDNVSDLNRYNNSADALKKSDDFS